MQRTTNSQATQSQTTKSEIASVRDGEMATASLSTWRRRRSRRLSIFGDAILRTNLY